VDAKGIVLTADFVQYDGPVYETLGVEMRVGDGGLGLRVGRGWVRYGAECIAKMLLLDMCVCWGYVLWGEWWERVLCRCGAECKVHSSFGGSSA
jgi:hypothetical protein